MQGTEEVLREHYEETAHKHLELVVVRVAQLEVSNTTLQGKCDVSLTSNLVVTTGLRILRFRLIEDV